MIQTVMIPGTLCDASVFDDVVGLLPIHDVYIADITQHSDVRDAAVSLLGQVEGRFLCAGFSLGGFVALEMMQRAPERLLGVVLIAGNAHPDRPELAELRRREAKAARKFGIDHYLHASLNAIGLTTLPHVAARVSAMARATGAGVLTRHAEMNISRPDFRRVVERTSVPLLVIAGECDPLCPPERYAVAAAGPKTRLIVLPGRGHYLPVEAPADVAAAIADMALAA